MYTTLIALAAAAALPAGAPARDASPKPAPTAVASSATDGATAARPAETRYCVLSVPTGSHMQTKTCHSRAEWLDQGFDPLARD